MLLKTCKARSLTLYVNTTKYITQTIQRLEYFKEYLQEMVPLLYLMNVWSRGYPSTKVSFLCLWKPINRRKTTINSLNVICFGK